MTHRHHSVFAGCVILAATAACAGANRGGSPSEGPTMIVFKNESLEQADVFAVRRGAGALRLGTVFGGRTDTLKIQEGQIPPGTPVDFVARLLTRSRTPHSGLVSIRPGEVLTVTLPSTANTLGVLPAQ